VRSDLMSRRIHALNDSGPSSGSIVNCTLSKVVTGNEEGCLCVICRKQIDQIVGIDVWSVVEGDGNGTRYFARIDTFASIIDVTKLRTRNSGSVGSSRHLVGIASWSILEETVGSCAIFIAYTAPSLEYN